ncbi:peptide-methionine (S)-S-oxide reductase MsrA [Asticcacaulis sp. EMRT-3]|uniref:peptide-methionine (S)-S-oxide reductase MsrA n=1 Tax=Asticcacaulis sp. EMRT-3 TaxID=3040349 RepID=UPI0024AF56D8|nr:peptide-methionine (S)-S-oxide reductase MsrA [Asticcacaulis sp. EMRT-3]MDI7775109.1 peptide-methionine (S)-S-oxide reductase MsrA [Asticcacaulis sp. EMRT-3]
MFGRKAEMIAPADALPGRPDPLATDAQHTVLHRPLKGPYPAGMESVVFAMGCFWGVERKFWQQPGVYVTAAGYVGGYTPNPTYEEVCSGRTGHTEGVLVVHDPQKISFGQLLKVFWENHDPTQGHRQGNDIGTQYRSAIYPSTDAQYEAAMTSAAEFQKALSAKGMGPITTEIVPAASQPLFYFAEGYHQGYLDKNPGGYCAMKGTGAVCVI